MRRTIAGPGLLALALLAQLPPSSADARRYALIVGSNAAPSADREQLRYADDDAARFFELVGPASYKALLLTELDAESQQTFSHLVAAATRPTVAAFEQAAAQIREFVAADARAGEASEVFFYYAGHGDVEDGRGYVTLSDGRLTRRMLETALIEGTQARSTHIVIDACKSYFLVAGRGPGGRREAYTQHFARARRAGVGYVLSTSSDAESHEWAAISGGVFSYEVRSALLGAADANLDGSVDYAELAAFVAVANEGIPFPRFRPSVFIEPPTDHRDVGLFAYSDNKNAALLQVPRETRGKIRIRDQRGQSYAEVEKSSAPLQLALVRPWRYEITHAGNTYSLGSDAATVPLASLTPDPPTQIAARGEAHKAFEHLFTRPFGPEVVRGYRLGRSLLPPDPPPLQVVEGPRWLTYGLVGAGAVATVAGVALGVSANNRYADASAASQAERPGLIDEGDGLRLGAGVALGLGVTSLAVAAAVELLD